MEEDEDEDPTAPIAPGKVVLRSFSAAGSMTSRTSLRLKRKEKKKSADKGKEEKKEKVNRVRVYS